jgi:predicted metalloprotease with PDZ domain
MAMRALLILVTAIVITPSLGAQHPFGHHTEAIEIRFGRADPVIHYILRHDSADVSGFDIEMRIRNAADTFRVAMAAHPEYDDRFWRFVERLRVDSPGGDASIAREDSALWRVIAPGGEAIVKYRIRLPAPEGVTRASWRPFMSATGALTGGPHAFMYVVSAPLAPAHVRIEAPESWEIATGLVPTSDRRTFFAPTAEILVDSPILAGHLRSWRYSVDGTPHRVVYWPLPNAVPFDTTMLVASLERLSREAVALFGRAPYREFTFLFQDGAFGGLEHVNSATLGAPSEQFARDFAELLGEAAHEYLHTWNLVRLRPAERGPISHRQTGQSRGLWWSEGLTIYYADLLARRAGIPTIDSTRIAHVERLIARYLFNPGNRRISAELAGLAEYGTAPGSLGDYDPSVHTQGELLGTVLDLVVREATNDRRSIDDVMRLMLERHSGPTGFTGRDIERAISAVCTCVVRPIFDAYVRGAGSIDVDRYLRTIGLRARVTWEPARDAAGAPNPDWRVFVWQPEGDTSLALLINNPEGAWGRAGLHTGDRLVSINGQPIANQREFRQALTQLRIGDTARVEVRRPNGLFRTRVAVGGYEYPRVRLEEIAGVTERQRARRQRWIAGLP